MTSKHVSWIVNFVLLRLLRNKNFSNYNSKTRPFWTSSIKNLDGKAATIYNSKFDHIRRLAVFLHTKGLICLVCFFTKVHHPSFQVS